MDARVVFDAIATYKAAWKINPAGKKMALLLQQFSPTQLTVMRMMIGDVEDEEAKTTYDEKEKDRWTNYGDEFKPNPTSRDEMSWVKYETAAILNGFVSKDPSPTAQALAVTQMRGKVGGQVALRNHDLKLIDMLEKQFQIAEPLAIRTLYNGNTIRCGRAS